MYAKIHTDTPFKHNKIPLKKKKSRTFSRFLCYSVAKMRFVQKSPTPRKQFGRVQTPLSPTNRTQGDTQRNRVFFARSTVFYYYLFFGWAKTWPSNASQNWLLLTNCDKGSTPREQSGRVHTRLCSTIRTRGDTRWNRGEKYISLCNRRLQ